MKTTIATIAAALLLAVNTLPGTIAMEDDDLVARNFDWFVEQVGDEYPLEAVAQTDAGPVTLKEVLTGAAQRIADLGVDLPSINLPAAGYTGAFPAAGLGLILELGIGTGHLPARCSSSTGELNLGANPAPTLGSKLGYAWSSLSSVTQLELAIAIEPTGLVGDAVVNYNTPIYWGATYDKECIDFEFCFFGFCFWLILDLGLFTGLVNEDTLSLAATVERTSPLF